MDALKYLRPKAAAEFLKDTYGHGSDRTLAKLRSLGGGPPFHKIGKPELIDWAESKISPPLASTSDRGAS